MRIRVGILAVAGAGLVALGCGAPPALAAPAPRALLTGNEYALLSASRLGLESALSERQPNWVVAAQNACLTLTYGPSTPLLASQKASCLASVGLRVTLARFTAAFDRCARRGPRRMIACREVLYAGLAREAASAYAGQVKAQRAILERGFTGACVTALGSTRMQLDDAHKLLASTRKLSGDWRLLVSIGDRQTLRIKRKQAQQIRRDTALVSHDIRLGFRHGQLSTDLSSCQHQAD